MNWTPRDIERINSSCAPREVLQPAEKTTDGLAIFGAQMCMALRRCMLALFDIVFPMTLTIIL
jgi:hypothetical protein